MTLQRSMYGLHAPVRHMMERNIVKQVRLAALSSLPPSLGTLRVAFGAAADPVLNLQKLTPRFPFSLDLQSPLPTSFGGFMRPSNLSLDILMGKDEEINFGDVLTGQFLLLLSLDWS
jgi:proteasome maturation protein